MLYWKSKLITHYMKKIFMLMCLFSFIMITVLNGQQTNQEFLQSKVNKFKTIKNTGLIMITAGTASTIGGIISMSNANWEETSDGYYSEDDDALLGLILTSVGIGLIAGGTTCAIIGNSKIKKYKRQLDALSFSPFITPNKAGLMLTLRF